MEPKRFILQEPTHTPATLQHHRACNNFFVIAQYLAELEINVLYTYCNDKKHTSHTSPLTKQDTIYEYTTKTLQEHNMKNISTDLYINDPSKKQILSLDIVLLLSNIYWNQF